MRRENYSWKLLLRNQIRGQKSGVSDLLNLNWLLNEEEVPVTDGGNGGQPACPGKWKRCRKKKRRQKMNNSNVMYIHVCSVSCNIVVMFACTLVRSHPDSRRRWGET